MVVLGMKKNTTPKKRGPKVDPEKRLEEIEATQYLAVSIRAASGKSSAELEHEFGLGTHADNKTNDKRKTGRNWNRYMNGERAMRPEQRISIALKAIRKGWIKQQKGIVYVVHERALGGANRANIRVSDDHSWEAIPMKCKEQDLLREKLLTHRKALLNEQKTVSTAQKQAIAALRGLVATLDSHKIHVGWWVPHHGYEEIDVDGNLTVGLSDMKFRSDVDDLISKIEAICLHLGPNGDLP